MEREQEIKQEHPGQLKAVPAVRDQIHHDAGTEQQRDKPARGSDVGRQSRGSGGAYSDHAYGNDQECPMLEPEQPYRRPVKQPQTRARQQRVQLRSPTRALQQRPGATERVIEYAECHNNGGLLLKVVCRKKEYEDKGGIRPDARFGSQYQIVESFASQNLGVNRAFGHPMHTRNLIGKKRQALADFLGLRRNLVLFLAATILIGAGEETWMRFVPKYLEALGAAAAIIGLYDALKTLLAAVYAYPGGVIVDRWGHRRGLVTFTALSIAGYALVLSVRHWGAVMGGMFLFLASSSLSLPAMFSLVVANLATEKHTMGIGIQSFTKRLPIVIGPIAGGLLLDRYGFVAGVRIGLAISIVLGGLSIYLPLRLQEEAIPAPAASNHHGSLLAARRPFVPRLRPLL